MTDQQPHTANIRRLLTGGFSVEELLCLIHDEEDDFGSFGERLGPGMSKGRIVDELIEFARQKSVMDTLLQWAKRENPVKYERLGPYYRQGRPDRTNRDAPETVPVPAGQFLMGSDPGERVPPYETPQHPVDLLAFEIGKYPITNRQYAEFVRKTRRRVAPEAGWEGLVPHNEKRDHPVVGVTWYDALAYCQWLSEQTGRLYTLPSEAQWEKAARGTDGRIYPWGNAWDPNRCSHRSGQIESVHAFKMQSVYGCCDMVGNAREWTSSLWGRRLIAPAPQFGYPWQESEADRDDLSAARNVYRVYRGGASDDEFGFRCSARNGSDPTKTGEPGKRLGFRVVCDR